MPELYKVLDPKDVPTPPTRGGPFGGLTAMAMGSMAVGDTIAVTLKNRAAAAQWAQRHHVRITTWKDGDLCYVKRLPDDAS